MQRDVVGFQWFLYFILNTVDVIWKSRSVTKVVFHAPDANTSRAHVWCSVCTCNSFTAVISALIGLTHLTVQLQLKLWDSYLWNHAGILNIQAPCQNWWHRPFHSAYPSREMSQKASARLWLHNLKIKPPFYMHLWKTHKINIEKAQSQLIRLSQRWTAESLISWGTAPWCAFCKGV